MRGHSQQQTKEKMALIEERIDRLENLILSIARGQGVNPGKVDDDDEELTLKALQLLDEGHTPVDIMLSLKIPMEEMKKVLEEYNALYSLTRSSKGGGFDYYMNIARLFGEQIRDVCPDFDEGLGVCNFYNLYDIDPELRRSCPGLFKGVGGKTRFHVIDHPEVCALCRRGVRRGE